MRAAVWHDGEHLTLEERPVPTPAATEVLIRAIRSQRAGKGIKIVVKP
ncbi:MAG: hypothetical protein ACREKF_14030 [Candidatus Methylomirabilales bacterium]